MKLLIAIPALNEEESIAEVIERSLAARAAILAVPGIHAVEVTVVSDGSTDRTVERASVFGDRIKLIVNPRTYGYGAAIKAAWFDSTADLLGFLDADGTYDPAAFADLCRHAVEQNADIVMGCRLNQGSRMPALRWTGNALFAGLLSVLAGRWVRDTATGMRVVRRTSLKQLMPLPDGLNFTPAMSARAVLSEEVRIFETNIPYGDRQGTSKLQVTKDGLRFLRVILDAAILYRRRRMQFLFALSAIVVAAVVTPLIGLIAAPQSSAFLGEPTVAAAGLLSALLVGAVGWMALAEYGRGLMRAQLAYLHSDLGDPPFDQG